MKNSHVMSNFLGSIHHMFGLVIVLSLVFTSGCAQQTQMIHKANTLFKAEKYDQAYEVFNRLASQGDKSDVQIQSMFDAAVCLGRLKRYEDALEKYSALTRQFPNSKWADNARHQIGMINVQRESYDAARRAFNRVLDDYPDSELKGNAQVNIAMLSFNEQKYDNAYKEYRKLRHKAFKDYPEAQAKAMYYEAYCLVVLDKLDGALDTYHELIENFPESEWKDKALFDIGKVALFIGNFERSQGAYETLLSELVKKQDSRMLSEADSEKLLTVQLELGHSYFGLKKWSEAIDAYNHIINEHKKEKDIVPICYYQIAEAYHRLAVEQQEEDKGEEASKNYERALSEYQKIIDNFPTDEIARHALYGMIGTLNDLGRKEELEYLVLEHGINESIHITGAPSDVGLAGISHFRIALTQEEHLKTYKEALESYERAIPLVKTPLFRAQAYYQRAVIYQDGLHQEDEAVKIFQTLVLEYENSEDTSIAALVADARKRLKELKGDSSKLTTTEIAPIAAGSTVRVEMNRKGGSGFFIGPGLIATNYHVIQGAAEGTAKLVGTDRTYPIVGYTAVDIERDLAILKVEAPSVKSLPFGKTKVDQGADVYPIGNPLEHENLFTSGKISGTLWIKSTRDFFQGSKEKSSMRNENFSQKLFVMNADITSGNSGGPVLNEKCQVIGIVVGHSLDEESINYAIPVDYLDELLKKTGTPRPLWQAGLAK